MNFPPINGVDEGSLVYVTVCAYTGFRGVEELWLKSKYMILGTEYQYNVIFSSILIYAMPLFSLVGFYNIWAKRDYKHFA